MEVVLESIKTALSFKDVFDMHRFRFKGNAGLVVKV